MTKDIFDMSDVSDLPEELRPSERDRRGCGKWEHLMAQCPGEFTAPRLRAAMYRETGIIVKINTAYKMISEMTGRGVVKKVSRGVYRYVGPSDA